MEGVRESVLNILDWMKDIRRQIHQHPEMGFKETATAALVAKTLRQYNIECAEGVGKTGVVGLWKADVDGPCLALRADMDALPLQELLDRPWKSTVPGVMHACGHDLHTAGLLGVARALAEDASLAKNLKGSVKLIFQPAEEGLGGAEAMIKNNVLKDPEPSAAFAAHVMPLLAVGQIGYCRGTSQASVDNYFITITGRGGHAAHPEAAADPIAPTAELVRRIKARAEKFDKALIAVSTFHAGVATNIIPEQATISGTIRAHDHTQRLAARHAVIDAVAEMEKETGLAAEVRVDLSYPMLVNDDAMTDLLLDATRGLPWRPRTNRSAAFIRRRRHGLFPGTRLRESTTSWAAAVPAIRTRP